MCKLSTTTESWKAHKEIAVTLTYNILRSVAIDCLAVPYELGPSVPPYTVHVLFERMARELRKRGTKIDQGHNAWQENRHGHLSLHPYVREWAQDIVWDLIIEGVLRPGYDDRSPDYPAIHLTEHGRESLVQATPYDPDKYLANLRQHVPSLDPVILTYVTESAETFRRNCLLSSTITLGCASEKAFLLLVDAYKDALEPGLAAQFEKDMKRARTIKLQHVEFAKWFNNRLKTQLKSSKGTDWLSSFEDALHLVFSYFRDVRNDAGHPTGAAFAKERVHSHLVIFPSYIRQFYDAIEWMEINKPLS